LGIALAEELRGSLLRGGEILFRRDNRCLHLRLELGDVGEGSSQGRSGQCLLDRAQGVLDRGGSGLLEALEAAFEELQAMFLDAWLMRSVGQVQKAWRLPNARRKEAC
jgi:hypothetical protein